MVPSNLKNKTFKFSEDDLSQSKIGVAVEKFQQSNFSTRVVYLKLHAFPMISITTLPKAH